MIRIPEKGMIMEIATVENCCSVRSVAGHLLRQMRKG